VAVAVRLSHEVGHCECCSDGNEPNEQITGGVVWNADRYMRESQRDPASTKYRDEDEKPREDLQSLLITARLGLHRFMMPARACAPIPNGDVVMPSSLSAAVEDVLGALTSPINAELDLAQRLVSIPVSRANLQHSEAEKPYRDRVGEGYRAQTNQDERYGNPRSWAPGTHLDPGHSSE
jgi:hypothetical protein